MLSRTRVFTLDPLAPREIQALLARALTDMERGLGGTGVVLEDEALEALVQLSGGDARTALSSLELAVMDASGPGGARRVTVADVEAIVERRLAHEDTQAGAARGRPASSPGWERGRRRGSIWST